MHEELPKKWRGTAECLVKYYCYTEEEAAQIICDYEFAIPHVGSSAYEESTILAKAKKENVQPSEWLEHINKHRVLFKMLDSNISEVRDIAELKKLKEENAKIEYIYLDDYDRKVVQTLVFVYRYNVIEAMEVFNRYATVYYILNDHYDGPERWAHNFQDKMERNIEEKDWLAHIDKLNKMLSRKSQTK